MVTACAVPFTMSAIGLAAQSKARPSVKPGSGVAFRDCPVCPEMVLVPAGAFTIGSPKVEPERESYEGPQHQVTIAKPFAAGKFAVTFAEWDSCAADGGCGGYRPHDRGWGRGDRPVVNVSWNDAKAYVTWLSGKTGQNYRLLSEAEREYVTRAGTVSPFWWGSTVSPSQANYDGTADVYKGGEKGEYRRKTLPVKSFQPNPWGLYQVHGNIWEWVEDCWNGSYNGAPADGSAWIIENCSSHVLRGGSWGIGPKMLRAASRTPYFAVYRDAYTGFRVARPIAP
jgi:formylglycine-generating enzyme required for sulfatase activity